MKTRFLAAVLVLGPLLAVAQQHAVSSPDRSLVVSIQTGPQLTFDLRRNGQPLTRGTLGLELADGHRLGQGVKVKSARTTSVNAVIRPEIRVKSAEISDVYTELMIQFREPVRLVVRAYDNAFAYRWETQLKDSITVKNEEFSLQVPPASVAYFQKLDEKTPFLNNYERRYEPLPFEKLSGPAKTQLPLLVAPGTGPKLLLTEADLFDYPGLYLTAAPDGALTALFPPVVKSTRMPPKPEFGWDRTTIPVETEPFLARTAGTRTFPWRIVSVAQTDADLLTNQLAYQLSRPNVLGDVSWVKPGKVAWDWWNDWNLTGVPFESGVNTETFKAYIDFAAQHGLEYVILDDGWYELGDLTKVVPGLNLEELVAYGKQKNVGLMLWASWKTLDDNLIPVLDQWARWGIVGLKIDFMDRDDQYVINFYERVACEAAKRKMLVDFHGAKPLGMHRAYPNIINYEGVQGLEQNKWGGQNANPDMAVTIPFIRMTAGPLDYTPGALRNAQRHAYAVVRSKPMSLGTRCHQVAMYVVYDAPLQMLSDSPSAYAQEAATTEFIAQIPTIWDRTVPLDGKVGEYVALARQHGSDWYLGAMTGWQARDLTLNLAFLPAGTYRMDLIQDGPNAHRDATDCQRLTREVRAGEKLTIHLAPGGGWAARLVRQ